MKKYFIVFVVVLVGIVGFILLREAEDTWICVDGQWVKHGNPAASQPTEPCPAGERVDTQTSSFRQQETLDLSGRGIDTFPREALMSTDVEVLRLSGNQLRSLPSEIGALTNLRELYLNDNFLTGALPAEIRHFQKLRILEARGNQLTGIPAEIGQLTRIERIDLSGNDINTYPNEIVNVKNTLKALNLAGNSFTAEQIQTLRTLLSSTEIIF